MFPGFGGKRTSDVKMSNIGRPSNCDSVVIVDGKHLRKQNEVAGFLIWSSPASRPTQAAYGRVACRIYSMHWRILFDWNGRERRRDRDHRVGFVEHRCTRYLHGTKSNISSHQTAIPQCYHSLPNNALQLRALLLHLLPLLISHHPSQNLARRRLGHNIDELHATSQPLVVTLILLHMLRNTTFEQRV